MPDIYDGIVKGLQEVIEYQKGERDLRKSDWIEVVRCKDCKWRGEPGCAVYIVDESDKPKDDDFCSWGEKKDNVKID